MFFYAGKNNTVLFTAGIDHVCIYAYGLKRMNLFMHSSKRVFVFSVKRNEFFVHINKRVYAFTLKRSRIFVRQEKCVWNYAICESFHEKFTQKNAREAPQKNDLCPYLYCCFPIGSPVNMKLSSETLILGTKKIEFDYREMPQQIPVSANSVLWEYQCR